MKPIIAVPATLALVYRAYSHKSLTPLGIIIAAATAVAHAIHPWNLPFALLVVFFLAGTRATKVKKDIKATLTMNSQGTSGGEGPRTHVQVLANSLVATVLALLHTHQLRQREFTSSLRTQETQCFSMGQHASDILVIGIIANYAAVAADTFSSELGILSRSEPRLITSLSLRKVPRGTNGGVTLWGLVAGLLGSVIVVTASMLFLPACSGAQWSIAEKATLFGGLAVWGALGSVLDSLLGGWLQRSVRDARTGKIVEGEGGVRVLVASSIDAGRVDKRTAQLKAKLVKGEGKAAVEKIVVDGSDDELASIDPYDPKDKHRRASFGDKRPTRVVESGSDLLDNNQVNFLMAVIMSVGGMVVAASYWGLPLLDAFRA